MKWLDEIEKDGKEYNYLTEGEIKKLINNADNLMEATLISLAVTTGIRRDDIVRIRVRDMDLDSNHLIYRNKKNDDGCRVVWISQKVSKMISKFLNKRESSSKYLFPCQQVNSSSGHLSGRSAYNILQRNLDNNGMAEIEFRGLRFSCIKLCQKKGWSPFKISKHLGIDLNTLKKYYENNLTPSDEEMSNVTQEKSLL